MDQGGINFLMSCCVFQRPSAKELLRHPFIRKARKNAFLQDLIDRYKRWKAERGNTGDSDSDSEE